MITSIINRLGNNQIIVRCDCCGNIGYVTTDTEDQTDRLLAHDWIHSNGWETKKYGKSWKNLCHECASEVRKARMKRNIAKFI